ncbi:MAG TPA: FG-GAP-like repeat-containing protein, partial [Gemmataceae bacterium]|nr:FG-GAP-like repeat-containing protein [Gemmataceae bacterium]
LDGDGADEIIAGVRDDPSPGRDQFSDRRGVRIYRCRDTTGQAWERQLIDEGGVAVEDLAVADLNGDGRPDIIAVGRQTGTARIYWNVK